MRRCTSQPERQPEAGSPWEFRLTKPPIWEKVTIVASGVGFLLILLAIALLVPEPTKFQFFIFRVVLALAAGGVGALIPGFIEFKFRNLIRAGGAAAFFAIVFFVSRLSLLISNRREKGGR